MRFTQTLQDKEGRPIRDPDSTTYTGAIENAESFSRRIYTEALRRGWDRALKKVVLADGAIWIWVLRNCCFPVPFRSWILTTPWSTLGHSRRTYPDEPRQPTVGTHR